VRSYCFFEHEAGLLRFAASFELREELDLLMNGFVDLDLQKALTWVPTHGHKSIMRFMLRQYYN